MLKIQLEAPFMLYLRYVGILTLIFSYLQDFFFNNGARLFKDVM